MKDIFQLPEVDSFGEEEAAVQKKGVVLLVVYSKG